MKSLKFLSGFILMVSFFTNCSTAQKLQLKSPVTFGEVYAQNWVAGIEGGGSGVNVFIPILSELPSKMQLDSLYFRGKVAKLELIKGEPPIYVARFISDSNQSKDFIMSSDTNEEYGNTIPKVDKQIPFKLKNSECVVSYQGGGTTKYFKIENIVEKPAERYPSVNKHQE